MSQSEPRPDAARGEDRLDGPVGYVLKTYPRFSETFVVNEIIAREEAGERIEIASLRATTDARFHARLAAVQAPVTWIPTGLRHADRLWELLRDARAELPRMDSQLGDLLAQDPDDAAQGIAVARWALSRGIVHLHAHFATVSTTVTRLASLLTGIPYSFTAHAKDIFHESVDQADLAAKIADAHHVVTVSDFNLAHLADRFAGSGARLHRVYNGLDLDRLALRTAEPAEPLLVAIGRFVEKKGFADLLDAVAILRDGGTKVPLALAGTGRLETQLREQATRTDLDDLVSFVGPLPQHEVLALLRQATVVAAPCVVAADGDRDGLPTVLIEAMAVGAPVVSTLVTGIPELVRDEETGLLVRERDPYALAAAIQRLLDEAPLRQRLAAQARAFVEAEFDVRRQASTLNRLRRGATVAEVAA